MHRIYVVVRKSDGKILFQGTNREYQLDSGKKGDINLDYVRNHFKYGDNRDVDLFEFDTKEDARQWKMEAGLLN